MTKKPRLSREELVYLRSKQAWSLNFARLDERQTVSPV